MRNRQKIFNYAPLVLMICFTYLLGTAEQAQIWGYIKDNNSKPVAHAQVIFSDYTPNQDSPGYYTESGDDGYYSLTVSESNGGSLQIVHPDYFQEDLYIDGPISGIIEQDVRLCEAYATVRIKLQDEGTHELLNEGATITITREGREPVEATTVAGDDGYYVASINKPMGDWYVTVSYPHYIDYEGQIQLYPPYENPVELDYMMAQEFIIVSGTITDKDTAEPMADAILRLGNGFNEQDYTTGRDGTYFITVYKPEMDRDWTLFASAADYYDGEIAVTPVLNDITEQDITLEHHKARFHGNVHRIMDDWSLEPLQSVVYLIDFGTDMADYRVVDSVEADEDGSYDFVTRFTGKRCYLTISIPSNGSTCNDYRFEPLNEGDYECDFTLDSNYFNFIGKVIDKTTGEPIEGATLKLSDEGTCTTNASGNFNRYIWFARGYDGEHSVEITADKYYPLVETISTDEHRISYYSFGKDFALEPDPTLSVDALRAEGVNLYLEGHTLKADIEGKHPLAIYSVDGKLLYQATLTTGTHTLLTLPSGLYFSSTGQRLLVK